MLKRFPRWIAILLIPAFLAACDSSEERAEAHFEKGMELLEAGDVDRALIEFRNVFKLNGTHREARLAYAQTQEDRGILQEAIGQYLRLVEQYPEDLEGRRALARLFADLNNWEEAGSHLETAEKLAPQDPVVQSVRAGLDYRNAVLENEPTVADLAVQVSEKLLQDHPDLGAARRVVIDDLIRRQDWHDALEVIDEALAVREERNLFMLRLAVLEQLGRKGDIITQLKDMEQRFPGEGIHLAVVERFIAEGQLDGAEAYLRGRAAEASADESQPQVELVSFLAQRRSREIAIAELDALLQSDTSHARLLRSLRAGLEFEAGNLDEALAEMESILKDAEPSEEVDRIKVALARMLIVTGNSVGARARVEEVLEHDAGQVEALKLKAGWLIDDDNPGDALVELRVALDQAPRDATIMTLMARAHERSGNRDLMGEMLALAVEASNSAPQESLRYVTFLLQDEKFLPAEDILKSALRLQRGNPSLLSALGGIYVQMEDWPRTQQVITDLQRLETEASLSMANELTARMLAGRNQAQELERFLGNLAEGEGGLQAGASIIRLRLAQGDVDGAAEYLDELLAQDPQNPNLRFVKAGVLIAREQRDDAEALLSELSEEFPQGEQIWLSLYRLQRSDGREEMALQTLAKAQDAAPNSGNLKWVAAGVAEQQGDIAGAIAIYEDLYALNSNSVVIANNLASLLASYQDDDASLERAYNIARRLRGTDVPALQDTYGWIAYRLGNFNEALEYLEPAAEGLPGDATVQFHLAEAYAALQRKEDALELYEKVVEMTADNVVILPATAQALDAIKRLNSTN